jgi:hypothetical protein
MGNCQKIKITRTTLGTGTLTYTEASARQYSFNVKRQKTFVEKGKNWHLIFFTNVIRNILPVFVTLHIWLQGKQFSCSKNQYSLLVYKCF